MGFLSVSFLLVVIVNDSLLHPLNKKIRPHFLVVIRLSLTFRLHLEEVIRLVRYKEHPSYFYFLKESQLDTEVSAGN